jgi:hypothetical protein
MERGFLEGRTMFAQLARRLLTVSLASLVVLSGCVSEPSGSTGSVPATAGVGMPAPMSAWAVANGKGGKGGKCGKGDGGSKGGSGGILYTAQLYGHDLKVYSRNGSGSGLTYECTLTQGVEDPNGTVTTVNGWWYVANGGGENVLVYRTKKGVPVGPLATLADFNNYATNVATNPSRNLVAVSNVNSITGGGGSLSIYLHRQAVPARVLTFGSSAAYGAGIALSHRGDCYWGVNTGGSATGPGEIVKFSKCNGSGRVVVSGIPLVGGVVFDQSDNLFYVNSAGYGVNPAGIYKCKKTSNCGPLASSGFAQPTNMNFDYKGKDLWVVDPGNGYIDEVSPASGAIVFQYSAGIGNDAAYGIAPEPGA